MNISANIHIRAILRAPAAEHLSEYWNIIKLLHKFWHIIIGAGIDVKKMNSDHICDKQLNSSFLKWGRGIKTR